MSATKGVSPARLAVAWVLHRGRDIVPIPGVRSVAHLEDDVAAAEVEITREDVHLLDEALPPGTAAGDRYPERGMRAVNR